MAVQGGQACLLGEIVEENVRGARIEAEQGVESGDGQDGAGGGGALPNR
ncbi:hypothetical protein [Rhodococcus pyridinivorans]|nr:hypothetical protein [Rhodococcus pyridinivorans]